MSLKKFKDTFSLLFSNGIKDSHLKGLLDTLDLGILLKYGESIEEELYLFNDSLPIDHENISLETIVKLLKEEIFRSLDYWKSSSYKDANKFNFVDEKDLLLNYINKNSGEDIIENYRRSFNLLLDIMNTFSWNLTIGERENHSLINSFDIIRRYVKDNNIKVDGSIFITSNFSGMSHSIGQNLVPSNPIGSPSSTLHYINTVNSSTGTSYQSISSLPKNIKGKRRNNLNGI